MKPKLIDYCSSGNECVFSFEEYKNYLNAVKDYKPYLDKVYKFTRFIPKEKRFICKGNHKYELINEKWICTCGKQLNF